MTKGFQTVLAVSEREHRDLFLAAVTRLGIAVFRPQVVVAGPRRTFFHVSLGTSQHYGKWITSA